MSFGQNISKNWSSACSFGIRAGLPSERPGGLRARARVMRPWEQLAASRAESGWNLSANGTSVQVGFPPLYSPASQLS